MNAYDLWPPGPAQPPLPARPPRRAFNLGETYLLRIRVSDAAVNEVEESPRPWKNLQGEIRARIAEVVDNRINLEISFGLTGFVEGYGDKFCFYSTESGDSYLLLDDGSGKLEFGFPAEFLSQTMQETLPSYPSIEEEDPDQFETPRDSYRGFFTAEMLSLPGEGSPPEYFTFTNGEIRLDPVDGNQGGAPGLKLSLEEGTFFRLNVGREESPSDNEGTEESPVHAAMAAAAAIECVEDQITGDHLLITLQPIVFTDENGANPTDQAAPAMIAAAQDTWNKACIVVDDRPFHPIPDSNLRTSGDINAIKLAFTSPDPLTIDVFFVDNNINSGGGKTLDGNTNLAKVFISDNAANALLLSHELCHVFRGDHPPVVQGIPPLPGRWFGDSGTVASATNNLLIANSPRNSRNNCINANTWLAGRNPALQTLDEKCCMKPDP